MGEELNNYPRKTSHVSKTEEQETKARYWAVAPYTAPPQFK
jgi:hypothetical protein